jgi:hypothetical protein
MALLVNHYIDRNFKVVEINNSVALRSGAIIAQVPLKKADLWANAEFIENGYFFNLDVNGELKAPGNANAALRLSQAPILHFTEELMTGPLTDLKFFAEIWEKDGVTAYPRGLVLTVGDTFTTNNFEDGTFASNFAAGIAILTPAGQLRRIGTAIPGTIALGYVGPVFNIVPSTLPDGETSAYEVTYLGNIQIAVAE